MYKSGIYLIQSGDSKNVARRRLLSELRNDHNFVLTLENELADDGLNTINTLLLAFELSCEDRCRVLRCATPCSAFLENLSTSQPQLSLQQLRDDIEMKSKELQNVPKKPNIAMFKKICEDIKNDFVSFTLTSTLGELSNDPKAWLYISNTFVANLVPQAGSLLISWDNIASKCGYTALDIANFRKVNTDTYKSPLQKILSLLCAREPSLPVLFFVKKLRQIKREDMAILVETWQGNSIVSIMIPL